MYASKIQRVGQTFPDIWCALGVTFRQHRLAHRVSLNKYRVCWVIPTKWSRPNLIMRNYREYDVCGTIRLFIASYLINSTFTAVSLEKLILASAAATWKWLSGVNFLKPVRNIPFPSWRNLSPTAEELTEVEGRGGRCWDIKQLMKDLSRIPEPYFRGRRSSSVPLLRRGGPIRKDVKTTDIPTTRGETSEWGATLGRGWRPPTATKLQLIILSCHSWQRM